MKFVGGFYARSQESFWKGPCLSRTTRRAAASPACLHHRTVTTVYTVHTDAAAPPTVAMPSPEARILGDFLVAPAALRDFMTLRQFTDIFPAAHRTNPAVQDVYRELQRLRERDVELVRHAIADEVKRSKRLRREYARERRQLDHAAVAGLDPAALQIEEEVGGLLLDRPRQMPC